MSFNRHRSISKVSGVGANQTFTADVPVGKKVIEQAGLELGGTAFAKTDLTNLEVAINGSPIQRFKTVAQLEAIRAYYQYPVIADRVVIPFRPNHLQNASQADLLCIGLNNIDTMQIKGDIGAATAPTLKAWSSEKTLRGEASLNDIGVFIERRFFQYSVSGAGVLELPDLPTSESIAAIHVFHTGNCTGGVAEADDLNVWDCADSNGGTARMEEIVKGGKRVPQTNVFHMDFMLSNELGGQLPVQATQDFRLKLDFSGADTVVVYVEYLNGL